MPQEMTISSTGFVNYFPSNERTERQIAGAYAKYGDDIIIINGEDDWFANDIFKVYSLLKKANIEILGDYHDGISGMSSSGAVIKKSDLNAFLEFVKKNWLKIFSKSKHNDGTGVLKYFDKDSKQWVRLIKTVYDHENDGKKILTPIFDI